jgi:hypothetical protein
MQRTATAAAAMVAFTGMDAPLSTAQCMCGKEVRVSKGKGRRCRSHRSPA